MKKVILVTGASRGIGNNIARSLAHENIVIANYNKSKDEAKKLKADLKSENIDIDIIKADVSNRTEVKEMIEGIITKYGKIDVLINNAGISQYKLFTDITDEDWENIMNINLKSNFIVTQEVVENMIANKNGLIINISSIWGVTGAAMEVAYSTSKAGIIGLTKSLAKELGPTNISDADAKKFYNENINKFKHPDKVRASHILISANPQEIEEIVKSDAKNKGIAGEALKAKVNEEMQAKEAKANQLLAEIKKDPTQFAKLAKENSDDTTTAVKGGDLGFFASKEMVPEFSKAAFSMKPNTVSDKVVKTQYGYHIIYVTDRAAAGQDPFEKVKNDIKGYLENQKQIEMIDNLTESLKKNAKMIICAEKHYKNEYK